MSEIQSNQTPLVLIVDDDRMMRSLLNLAIEEEGYRVAEAENGEQCLAEYTHFQPDLVLLDAVMPDIDGFTCCKKIRSLPGGKRIPIMIITVLDDQESVDQAFNAGATDYITKPIHWSVLSQRVHRLLDSNRTWTELKFFKEKSLRQQSWSMFISQILRQINSSDRSNDCIQTVLVSIQEWLSASRTILYQSDSQIYLDSGNTKDKLIKEFSQADLNLIAEFGEQYQQGKPIFITDVSQADFSSVLIQHFEKSDNQALMVVPIKKAERILGWLEIQFSEIIPQDSLLLSQLLDFGNLLAIVIS